MNSMSLSRVLVNLKQGFEGIEFATGAEVRAAFCVLFPKFAIG